MEDLLSGSAAARALFPFPPGDAQAPLAAADTPRRASAPRDAVCARIRALLRRLEAPPAAHQALERLGQPDSVAVVTGQQLGLWGGPLYTTYKLLGALLLARSLEQRGRAAVPVFWLEGEDHDFAEAARLVLPDREDRPTLWQAPEPPNDKGRPIASRTLPPELEEAFALFESTSPETEFKAGLLERLRRAYAPGQTFIGAFGRWLLELFGDLGVICIDPTDPELKRLAAPLFESVGAQAREFGSALAERNGRLEALGYAPQVRRDPDTLPFFLLADGRRTRSAELDGPGLRARARSAPESLSPDVLLRPLYQDYLLPSAAYVAGPSEVSYLAQSAVLYPLADLRMPAIVPRPHALVLESRSRRLLERLGLELQELLEGDPQALRHRLVPPHRGQQALTQLQQQVSGGLEALRPELVELDPNLFGPLDKSARELEQVFGRLQGKVERSLQQRHEQSLEQLRRLLDQLLPLQQPQERVLTLESYLVRYGPELPGRFLDQLQIAPGELQILDPAPQRV